MTTIPGALKLAYEILGDFEVLILPSLPKYRTGGRYKEVEEIIEELKAGKIELHPMIDKMIPFAADELMDEKRFPVSQKLTKLKWMLVELKKKN